MIFLNRHALFGLAAICSAPATAAVSFALEPGVTIDIAGQGDNQKVTGVLIQIEGHQRYTGTATFPSRVTDAAFYSVGTLVDYDLLLADGRSILSGRSDSAYAGLLLGSDWIGSGPRDAGSTSINGRIDFGAEHFEIEPELLNFFSSGFQLTYVARIVETGGPVPSEPIVVTIERQPVTVRASVTVFSSPIPEPGAWAMMVLGFGMVGLSLRARGWSFDTAVVKSRS